MILFKALSAIIGFLILTSCARITPIAYDCPIITLPTDPIVPIMLITSTSSPDEVMKAWVATAIAYRDWNRVVHKQIADASL